MTFLTLLSLISYQTSGYCLHKRHIGTHIFGPYRNHKGFVSMAEPISDRSKFAVTEASVWSDFQGTGKDSFRCAFSKLSSSDLRYDVLWNVDGLWIYEDVMGISQSSDVLPASRATLREGSKVSLGKVYTKWTRFAKDYPRRLAWK